MAVGSSGGAPKHLRALFSSGPVGDLADGVLLDRFLATRDEVAFEAIVARHGPMVLRLCRSTLGDPHEAEDAFQAVFLILVRQAAAIRSHASVASWLFGVASRVSARARVDAGRRRRHEREAAEGRATTTPERVDEPPDPFPVLREELARLPERYRETVVLCYLEGHSCDAAAQRLRRPVGTVKARLSRARVLLKQRLQRRGIALPAALLAAGSVTAEAAPTLMHTELLRATVSSAAGAAVASVRAVSLAEGVLRMMVLHKLRVGVALLLPVMFTAGALVFAWASSGTGGEPPAKAGAEASPPGVAVQVRLALDGALAGATGTADPYTFTFALIRLAKAQIASGDRAAALATFGLADKVAGTVQNEHLRRLALMRTAVARGRAGDTAPAKVTLDRFAHEGTGLGPEARYSLMSMVIDFLFQAGFQAEARETLKTELAAVEALGDERLRDGGIHRLFYSRLTLNDYEGALREAERYTGDKSNTRAALLQTILTFKRAGDDRAPLPIVKRARELAAEVTYAYPRAMAEGEIAAALARVGDIDGALTLARAIHTANSEPFELRPAVIPPALVEIARAQAKAGARTDALKTLREAFTVAQQESTDRGVLYAQSVRQVVEAQAALGDVDAAKASADTVENEPMEKALALAALARAQGKAGRGDAAAQTLREALTAARAIGPRANFINDDPTGNADRAFRDIALAQAETGDAEGARATVAGRGSDAWKSETLAAVAPIQARLGDIPGALATARSITEPSRAGEAYSSVASVEARSGGAESALSWASRLDSPAAKAFALIGIAEGLAARSAAEPRKP